MITERGHKATIVVVDDNYIVRSDIWKELKKKDFSGDDYPGRETRNSLSKRNVEVIFASNFEEAVTAMQSAELLLAAFLDENLKHPQGFSGVHLGEFAITHADRPSIFSISGLEDLAELFKAAIK